MKQRLTLPKSSLLQKSWQFQEVYRKGRRVRGDAITIIHRANSFGSSRLGISAHGYKKAVQRNRIKRIIREYFRLHGERFSRHLSGSEENQARDIIFAVRREFAPLNLRDFSEYLDTLLQGRS